MVEVFDRAGHLDGRRLALCLRQRTEAFKLPSAGALSKYEGPHLLQHLRSGTATAIPIAKKQKGLIVDVDVLVVPHRFHDFCPITLSIVSIDRCHVREHLGSINADPIEGGIWEDGDVVPAQLSVSSPTGCPKPTF